MLRNLFIAGNWKMNPATAEAARALAEAVKAGVGQEAEVRVAVCPPAVFLHQVDATLAGSPIGQRHWRSAMSMSEHGCKLTIAVSSETSSPSGARA